MCFSDNTVLEPLALEFISGIAKQWQEAQMYNYIHQNDKDFEKSELYKQNKQVIKDVKMFLLGNGFPWFYPIDGVGIIRKLNREFNEWKRKYDSEMKENNNA